MKQSLGLIILQILGLVVSFFTIIFVASQIVPEVYAVMGVFAVVTGTMRALSGMGLESFAIRNILMWREEKQYEKIEMAVSQALFSRLIAGIVLVPIMAGYVYFISSTKFAGQYFGVFLLFIVSGLIFSFNNSISLSLLAFNRYFLSSLIDFSVNVLGHLAALYLFIHYGFNVFIITIVFLPFISFIILIKINYRWIKRIYLQNVSFLLSNVWENREFLFLEYIQYIFKSFDQLLVSIIASPQLFSVFSLAKRIEDSGEVFVDNLFDPFMQRAVEFKNNQDLLDKHIRVAKRWHQYLIAMAALFVVTFFFLKDYLIDILHLAHYSYVDIFFFFAVLSNSVYLLNKYMHNYLSFLLN